MVIMTAMLVVACYGGVTPLAFKKPLMGVSTTLATLLLVASSYCTVAYAKFQLVLRT